MPDFRVTEINEQTLLEIDYTGADEAGMISLISRAAREGITGDKKVLVLAIHYKNFITPKFVQHARSVTQNLVHFIDKMAMVGLNRTQKLILKGYSIFFQRNFKAFDTREEALKYLLDKNIFEDDLPEYYKEK